MKHSVREPAALLDALASFYPDASRTTLRQMLQSGRVRVNGEIEKNARRALEAEDAIDVAQKSVQIALPPGLAILHEDDDILVVLKSHGLLTVATERERETTAQAYLNQYLKQKGEERVHVAVLLRVRAIVDACNARTTPPGSPSVLSRCCPPARC